MINRKNSLENLLYSKTAQSIVFVLVLACAFTYTLLYGYAINQLRFFDGIILLLTAYFLFYSDINIDIVDVSFLSLVLGYYFIAIYKYINAPLMSPTWDSTYYAWTMPALYLLGKLVVGYKKENFENRAFLLTTVLGAGMYIQGLLNYGVLASPLANEAHSVSPGFWNRDIPNTRNVWDIGFVMVLGSIFYAVKVRKTKKKFSIILIVAAILALIINLGFNGRTESMIAVSVFLLLSLVYIFTEKKYEIILKHKSVIIKCLIAFLTLILLAVVAYSGNIMGFRKMYDESFLARDGGVFNNIRFHWAIIAFCNIFEYEYGGWALDESINYRTTHNSWLEFGRAYDDIVFCLIVFFLIVTIIRDIYGLLINSKKHDISYYVIGSKLGLIIISIINPDFHQYMDMMAVLVFTSGITSGVSYATERGDYKIICSSISSNRFRFMVPGYGILMMALVASAYIDWWNGSLQLLPLLILPMGAYLISSLFSSERCKEILLIVVAVLCVIIGIYMRLLSEKSGTLGIGLYVNPFTKGTTLKSAFIAFAIIPIAVLLGFIAYKFKVNKIIVAVITTIISGIDLIPQIIDGRFTYMKEALYLLYTVTFKTTTDAEKALGMSLDYGNSWMNSKENVLGMTTSHNMWLDFARNYGLIVLGILIAFEIWSIISFIKMIKNKDKTFVNYALIIAFILFNYHFMLEATAFSNKYIWILGMFVYGMITVSVVNNKLGVENI
jgi:hypothetical protein